MRSASRCKYSEGAGPISTQGGLYQYTGGLVLSPEAEDLSVHGGSDGEQSDEQKKSGDEEYNNSVASVALRRAFRQILKPEEQPLESAAGGR